MRNKIYFLFLFLLLTTCATSEKNIKKAAAHHKIAVGLIKDCENPRALGHLLKAIKFSGKDFLIRHTLAATYYSMKRYDKALLEFKKTLKINPNFTESRVNLARVYIDLNQADKALAELKKTEKDLTYANYFKIVSEKGLAYYKKQNYKSSKKWFEEARSLPQGNNCFVSVQLGKAELALGNLQLSEKILKKSLSLCRNDKPLCSQRNYEEQMVLAQIYIKKGDKKRAKYHLNIFIKKIQKGPKLEEATKLLQKIS